MDTIWRHVEHTTCPPSVSHSTTTCPLSVSVPQSTTSCPPSVSQSTIKCPPSVSQSTTTCPPSVFHRTIDVDKVYASNSQAVHFYSDVRTNPSALSYNGGFPALPTVTCTNGVTSSLMPLYGDVRTNQSMLSYNGGFPALPTVTCTNGATSSLMPLYGDVRTNQSMLSYNGGFPALPTVTYTNGVTSSLVPLYGDVRTNQSMLSYDGGFPALPTMTYNNGVTSSLVPTYCDVNIYPSVPALGVGRSTTMDLKGHSDEKVKGRTANKNQPPNKHRQILPQGGGMQQCGGPGISATQPYSNMNSLPCPAPLGLFGGWELPESSLIKPAPTKKRKRSKKGKIKNKIKISPQAAEDAPATSTRRRSKKRKLAQEPLRTAGCGDTYSTHSNAAGETSENGASICRDPTTPVTAPAMSEQEIDSAPSHNLPEGHRSGHYAEVVQIGARKEETKSDLIGPAADAARECTTTPSVGLASITLSSWGSLSTSSLPLGNLLSIGGILEQLGEELAENLGSMSMYIRQEVSSTANVNVYSAGEKGDPGLPQRRPTLERGMNGEQLAKSSFNVAMPDRSSVKDDFSGPMPDQSTFTSALNEPMSYQSTVTSALNEPMPYKSTATRALNEPMPYQSTATRALNEPMPYQSTATRALNEPMPYQSTVTSALNEPMSYQSTITSALNEPMPYQSTVTSALNEPMPYRSTVTSALNEPMPYQSTVTSALNEPMPYQSTVTSALSEPMPYQSTVSALNEPMPYQGEFFPTIPFSTHQPPDASDCGIPQCISASPDRNPTVTTVPFGDTATKTTSSTFPAAPVASSAMTSSPVPSRQLSLASDNSLASFLLLSLPSLNLSDLYSENITFFGVNEKKV